MHMVGGALQSKDTGTVGYYRLASAGHAASTGPVALPEGIW
jgi:hypothetical protein